MSVFLSPNLPANVVEIGNEISQAKINEINAGTLALQTWVSASFLTTASASSTYQTISGMTSYLTTASAASTYATRASPTFTGTVTIPAGASISGYLTTASASSTYQPLSGMTSYLTTASAASIYQTISGMSSYATQSYVTSQGYLTDAPSNGSEYVRKNGAWSVATGGGGGGGISNSDISFWLTQGSSYLQPTGIASGYVLSYNGTDLVWVASSGGGGGISDAPADSQFYARINNTWNSFTIPTLSVTNIDLTGNFNGYSVGSGYFSFKYDSSTNTLRMQDGVGSGVTISATGITFPDSTTLTTSPSAFVDAPSDGNYYVRRNGAWHQCQIANVYDNFTMSNQDVLRI